MISERNSESDPPIDYREVLERIGGDTAFLEELLNIYFLEFQEKKDRIAEALKRADFALIKEIGHSIKGASANLSLPSLCRDAAALEAAGRDRNLDRAKHALGSLIAGSRALQDYLRKNPPAAQSS